MRNLIDNIGRDGAALGLAFEVGRGEALSKAAVNFRGEPHGGARCGKCWHFAAAQSKCQIVGGEITAGDWCAVWAGRSERA